VDDYPRRRRLAPQEPKKGGGLPIFPLIVLVIFAGLLLGGGLAKFFGNRGAVATSAPTFTPLPAPTATFAPRATPIRNTSPSPSLSASPSLSPSPSPSPTARAHASASASIAPSASTSPTPTVRPSVIYITAAPKASPVKTPAPLRTAVPLATATPAPVLVTGPSTGEHAAAIVRSYLAAVGRNDEATAAGYLQRGLPNESFFTSAATITDLETVRNPDGTFTVKADISTPSGEYYETFNLAQGPGGLGLQIVQHYAIKVQ